MSKLKWFVLLTESCPGLVERSALPEQFLFTKYCSFTRKLFLFDSNLLVWIEEGYPIGQVE